MLIITIRTDKPEAEVGLYEDHSRLAYKIWHAHRELSVTLHQKILDVLSSQSKGLSDIKAIAAFAGPGSFTGLRIGLTVADTLAYAERIPVVATTGEDWIEQAITRLLAGENETIALPQYGAPANITVQKK